MAMSFANIIFTHLANPPSAQKLAHLAKWANLFKCHKSKMCVISLIYCIEPKLVFCGYAIKILKSNTVASHGNETYKFFGFS